MRINNQQVDIIIPVYNALEDLKKCISSILKNTDLSKHRLILINDKSTDENVGKYFLDLKQDGIYKIENDINLGFSGTINKGITLSRVNDVILLNSDTIVTNNWIDDLIECAYTEDSIGTVTPLSNNASICSVPYSNQNNLIPENMSLDEYAQELRRTSLYQYPDIPVGIGFCMYIKRSVIDDVGLFDSGAFGVGYGEENDFCNRAVELGYRHALCDTVFIYHKGTASFNDENKRKLINEHQKILEKRYPNLVRKLEWFWEYQQNGDVAKNVEIYNTLRLGNNKKNIFYLIQADFQQDASNNVGGTQLHVKDLVEGLKFENNIFVAARDREYLRVTAYVDNQEVPFKFYIGNVPDYYKYRDGMFAELYKNLLVAFKIDLVHIHHTMGMTLELYYMANDLSIPIFVTLHDYYYICPTLQLLDSEGKICIGKDSQLKCSRCMKQYNDIFEDVKFISKWRKEHAKALNFCDKIIIPSSSAADIILKYYPQVKEKLEVIPHGINNSIFSKKEVLVYKDHKELHVAFVGGICETKGAKLINSLISSSEKMFKWYIFGGIDSKDLSELKQGNLTKTGWYQREELKRLLNDFEIDVVCILSKIAETYCYTLSEVVACGVPVVVTDIGALGERMRTMQCGWIIPPEISSQELLNFLIHIKNNPEEYMDKVIITNNFRPKTIEDMIIDYKKIYIKFSKLAIKDIKFNSKQILDGYLLAKEGIVTNQIEMVTKISSLESELSIIYDSELYKILKKLAGLVDKLKKLTNKINYFHKRFN